MELLKLLQVRRSIRKYKDEAIPEDKLTNIVRAGLLAPSSRGIYPVEFVVVRDKNALERFSESKAGGATMLKNAGAAVVVIGDAAKSDAWIEDCSIAMTLMQLEATEQGIGSCWVQCRGRQTPDGASTEDYIRTLLNIPKNYSVLAMLSLGIADEKPEPRALPDVKSNDKIHQ